MIPYSGNEDALVLRTDFTSDESWHNLCAVLRLPEPEEEFLANVECVDDARFKALNGSRAIELLPSSYQHPILVLADQVALDSPELPLLVIHRGEDEHGRTIRVVATELWSIENHLAWGNMDFSEFSDNVDDDGVLRGFD